MRRTVAALALLAPLALGGCGQVYTAVCERVGENDGREIEVEWTTLDVPGYGPMYGVTIDGQELMSGGETAAHISAGPRGFKTAGLQDVMLPARDDPDVYKRWTGARINVLELDDAGQGTLWSWDVNIDYADAPAAKAAWDHDYAIPPMPKEAEAILRCRLDERW